MAPLLVLMGSGETTPTMVTPHGRILSAVDDGPAVILDTPYGFQENADELSARTVEYFQHNVGHPVEVVSLRVVAQTGAVQREAVTARIRESSWVFAGPGSPTYLAAQWLATDVPAALRERLGDGSRATATVLASAAACTAGQYTIPVYELYKVGQEPHWQDGLDLLRPLGLDAIVVPHYDNAEGGTHDTSCCYIGDRRLQALEARLESHTWVLGIDEHTAAVLDVGARTLQVEGRGRVVVRMRERVTEFVAGTTVGFDALLAAAGVSVAAVADAQASGSSPGILEAAERGAQVDFEAAVDARDLLAAAEVTTGLLGDLTGPDRQAVVRQLTTLARIAQSGLHEHRTLVAPHVETLLRLREHARDERRFADADAIRDALLAAGIEVKDGREGTVWDFEDPLAGVL